MSRPEAGPAYSVYETSGDPGPAVPKVIIDLGHRTAEYYRLLCDEGLPKEFAQLLARDWHAAQLAKWTAAPYTDRYSARDIESDTIRQMRIAH